MVTSPDSHNSRLCGSGCFRQFECARHEAFRAQCTACYRPSPTWTNQCAPNGSCSSALPTCSSATWRERKIRLQRLSAPPPPSGASALSLDARHQYNEQFLWLEDTAYVQVNTGRVLSTRVRPMKGKYREPLSWPVFYWEIRRDDLALEYTRRQRTSRILLAAGILSSVAAVGLVPYGVFGGECKQDSGYCYTREPIMGAFVAAGILGVSGAAMILIGALRRRQPIDISQVRRLADEHNQLLRRRLGLPEDTSLGALSASTPRAPQLTLATGLTSGGGYLGATLRF